MENMQNNQMNNQLTVETYDEKGFKEMVMNEHKKGAFSGDTYNMTVDFSTRKSATDFVGISLKDSENNIVGFCGMETFIGTDDLVGYHHCLGVPAKYRGNKYSIKAIEECEKAMLQKQPNIVKILAVCNSVGEKCYEKLGYYVTNDGWEGKQGTRMHIRLQKDLNGNSTDGYDRSRAKNSNADYNINSSNDDNNNNSNNN